MDWGLSTVTVGLDLKGVKAKDRAAFLLFRQRKQGRSAKREREPITLWYYGRKGGKNSNISKTNRLERKKVPEE